ncbi:carbohydrate ABC transporter permease [Pygmaiobacter massiliensis]|uniref:carbohydrate ABC transporter permease n=1 Tax=Pygmaiobacter massiliensis TaxID=1917873 RepID=UPI000C7E31AF|nr:sugar ABC transporter permease [Pygmaiobacter massiliensis]
MKSKNQRTAYPLWLAGPGLLVYSLFFIVPIFTAFGYSFTNWNLDHMHIASWVGISNFVSLLKDEIFLRSIANTLIFALFTTFFKTLIGLLLALLVVKKFPGNSIFRTLFYLPCVLSTMIVGLLFTAILKQDGLLNNLLNSLGLSSLTRDWLGSYGSAMAWIIIVEIWMWAGFSMFIFISGLQAISKDYYESAQLEGATSWQQFRHITMPLLAPSFTVVTTLNITGGLKVFDLVYALTGGGPGFDTQVLSTYVYRAFSMGQLGRSSAAAILLSILVVAITFLLNRFLKSREVET